MPYYRRKKVLTNRALTKKVREMENEPELKYKDTEFNVTQTDMVDHVVSGQEGEQVPTTFAIGLVGQGVDARARIGDFIRATSLKIRLSMRYAPNTNISPTAFIRMILYYDSSPQGEASVTVGQANSVLDIGSSDEYIYQMYNYSEVAARYKILMDKTYTLNSQTIYEPITGNWIPQRSSRYIKKTIKLGRKTIYSGPDGLIGDVQTNGLYVTWLFYAEGTDESNLTTAIVTGTMRMYYKDE